MTTSLAAVVTGFGEPLELQRVRVPELESGGVLVQVEAATLCGSDVHFWHGATIGPERLPYIPGHETCGRIVDLRGERSDLLGHPLEVGDRVIAAYPTCGNCYYCTIARQALLCPHLTSYGRARCDQPPYLLGGCAEHHYFPPRCDLIRVPDEVSSPLAASAACALRTVMHAFEKLGQVASHETVLIQGAGPVGLYAAAVARDRGARNVLVVGAPASRLQVAINLGADDVLDISACTDVADRLDWARGHTDGRGPDVVIQCANSLAIPEGLELVRRGGRFVSVGATRETIPLPGGIFTTKFVNVFGILMAEGRHFYQAVDFLATRGGRFPFDQLITGEYSLATVGAALEAMENLREVKPVVIPGRVETIAGAAAG